METQPTPDTWAICELMGHVKLAGRLSEEERFGSKFGRMDIPMPETTCTPCNGGGRVLPLATGSICPECGGKGKIGGGFITQYFGGGSVYRISIVSEEAARFIATTTKDHLPVSQWDFPPPRVLKALPEPASVAPDKPKPVLPDPCPLQNVERNVDHDRCHDDDDAA